MNLNNSRKLTFGVSVSCFIS